MLSPASFLDFKQGPPKPTQLLSNGKDVGELEAAEAVEATAATLAGRGKQPLLVDRVENKRRTRTAEAEERDRARRARSSGGSSDGEKGHNGLSLNAHLQ